MNTLNSVKDTEEKGKKPCNIDLKISMKILFHYTHLPFLSSNPKIKAFLATLTFPTKMKPTNCPAREKKKEARKAKKEGRGLRESKK